MALQERKTLGMELPRQHVHYILKSGNVEGERPLSTLILAYPERAKTTEVMKFNDIGAIVKNDLTAYGLAKIIAEMKQVEKAILHHLIIPDLERIGARNVTVRQQLLATLQILMQEGLTSVTTHEIQLECNPPIRLGVIMCTTPEDLGDKRSIFRRLSFLSRLIPFSYDFSKKHRADILKYIEEADHLERQHFILKDQSKTKVTVPREFVDRVNICAKIMAYRIEEFASKKKGKEQMGKLVGIRAKEDLLCYLKAIALVNHRTEVTEEDFEEFERMFRHFNFGLKELDYK
jgi:hypothetical protein